MNKQEKIYTVKTTKTFCRTDRADSVNEISKSLAGLIKHFSYTLEIGNSYNKKISRNPKTINSFISNLQKAYDERETSNYDKTFVELVL